MRRPLVKAVATAALGAAVAAGAGSPAPPKPEVLNPAVLPLRNYQQRWIDDNSRFKISVKSARIGFSFATALEAVLDCIQNPKTTWTVLSASKPQSVEFIQTCHTLLELIHGAVELYQDESFFDELGEYEAIQQRVTLANGSRIIALAANARTARGYPGNAILDEFAHHEDSYAIWAAITRQLSLGHKVRVLSTPNGEQGKFFDICKELGLVDGVPENNFGHVKGWSIHFIDVDMAVADGCPINMAEMRQLIQDDDIVNQEFYCVFLKSTGSWLGLDLLQAAEDAGATMTPPPGWVPRGRLFGGIDVGRVRDRTTFWLKEEIGGVLWTRMVLSIHGMKFQDQAKTLAPFVKLTRRTALDSTGMGIALWDLLGELCPGKVMAVNFAGSSRLRDDKKKKNRATSATEDGAVSMKTDLAIRFKRSFEGGKERIPYSLDIRTELQAIKRVATSSGVTFDAPRIAIETGVAGGPKQKGFQHADHFWGSSLATYAASTVNIATTGVRAAGLGIKKILRGY
ncbi:MAG TPA: terminase family protein [Acidobacteriaceae bacterium]|jgi:phage FluMu gp28-like protein